VKGLIVKLIFRLIFAAWLAFSAGEDALFGGVSRGVLYAAVLLPATWAALTGLRVYPPMTGGLCGGDLELWHCVLAMMCFAAAGKTTRAVCVSNPLGEADIFAAGANALFTGSLWALSSVAASLVCALYCVAAKKRSAPFIPFMNAGAVFVMILRGAGLIASDGGLLYD
jgi:hypothetical protein